MARILRRPDLSLEHVWQCRDFERLAEYLSRFGPLDEIRIPRIGLDLHAKARVRSRYVQAMGKSAHGEFARKHRLDDRNLVGCHDDIEVQTNQWIDISVDTLAPDHAVGYRILLEELDYPVE